MKPFCPSCKCFFSSSSFDTVQPPFFRPSLKTPDSWPDYARLVVNRSSTWQIKLLSCTIAQRDRAGQKKSNSISRTYTSTSTTLSSLCHKSCQHMLEKKETSRISTSPLPHLPGVMTLKMISNALRNSWLLAFLLPTTPDTTPKRKPCQKKLHPPPPIRDRRQSIWPRTVPYNSGVLRGV